MKVVVVGGKLQGFEAVYLAKKAGWEVVLVDINSWVPAAKLCDQFYSIDVTNIVEWIPILKDIDLIIPALENKAALDSLVISAKYANVPLMFDEGAYDISSSKIKSNELFTSIGIPAPIAWPACGLPLIVKPSGASGSEGVIKIKSRQDFDRLFIKSIQDCIIEEYLEGPSYSLEVIGFSGVYKVLQITELHMDQVYDCKRVLGSAHLSDHLKSEFEQIGLSLAKTLNLNGIMDVETILHQGNLKVLEIDARLPSQTPIAVYNATGINMLEILGQAFVLNRPWQAFEIIERQGAILEHISVGSDCLEVSGEHIMSDVGPLYLYPDFFGTDETFTNYSPGKTEWVATLIITGKDMKEAWDKRCEVIQAIRNEWGIRHYFDRYPEYEQEVNLIKSASGS